jgi:hypothetical protein
MRVKMPDIFIDFNSHRTSELGKLPMSLINLARVVRQKRTECLDGNYFDLDINVQ